VAVRRPAQSLAAAARAARCVGRTGLPVRPAAGPARAALAYRPLAAPGIGLAGEAIARALASAAAAHPRAAVAVDRTRAPRGRARARSGSGAVAALAAVEHSEGQQDHRACAKDGAQQPHGAEISQRPSAATKYT
jgi:hypothetical protein